MTPLARLLLRAMRGASRAAAAFTVLVIGIELWKRWRFGVLASMSGHDITFMAILVLMLGCFLWLARAISRELAEPGS